MSDIKIKVDQAVEVVKDIPPELRVKAFEIVLNKLINEGTDNSSMMEENEKVKINSASQPTPTMNENRIEQFSQKIGVSADDLRHVFDFDLEKKKIRIIKSIEGEENEKQVLASLLYLTAKHYLFDEDTAKSSELREMLKMHGIGSLTNFSKNMKKAAKGKDVIFSIETVSSGRSIYKITYHGLNMGKNEIQKLVSGEPKV